MRVTYTFFCGLTGAKLPNISAPGLKIFEDFKILTDKPSITRRVSQYIDSIGKIEFYFLCGTCSGVLFREGHFKLSSADDLEERANGLVIANLALVENWLSILWLMEDNAVNHDTGWLAFRVEDKVELASNTWSHKFTRSNGSAKEIVLSKEHLKVTTGAPLISEYGNDVGPVPIGEPGFHGHGATKLSKDSVRIQRFLYFCAGARAARDLALKIVNYCSALEALVSSSSSELTHQVAERVALLIGETKEQRLDIFRRVKIAYAMRSRAVHGSAFKSKDEIKLEESSGDLDNICRKCLFLFFQDRTFKNSLESSNEDFNNYWLDLIFK